MGGTLRCSPLLAPPAPDSPGSHTAVPHTDVPFTAHILGPEGVVSAFCYCAGLDSLTLVLGKWADPALGE